MIKEFVDLHSNVAFICTGCVDEFFNRCDKEGIVFSIMGVIDTYDRYRTDGQDIFLFEKYNLKGES